MAQERCNRGCNAGADLFSFLDDSSTILRTRFESIVVGNESDDNSYVAHDRGSQNRRFAKRGPRSSGFAKKGSAKQQVPKKGVRGAKSLETSDLRRCVHVTVSSRGVDSNFNPGKYARPAQFVER